MKPILPIAALTGLALTAGIALAGERTPPANWMSVADLAALLETQGYELLEVERDDGVYEVKMRDGSGYTIEADLDPVTGERLAGPRWND